LVSEMKKQILMKRSRRIVSLTLNDAKFFAIIINEHYIDRNMKYILLLSILVLLLACTAPDIIPPVVVPEENTSELNTTETPEIEVNETNETIEEIPDLAQTDPSFPCETDEDCWCKIFDGTQFIPGKSSGQGLCCTEDMIGQSSACRSDETVVGHCGTCQYY